MARYQVLKYNNQDDMDDVINKLYGSIVHICIYLKCIHYTPYFGTYNFLSPQLQLPCQKYRPDSGPDSGPDSSSIIWNPDDRKITKLVLSLLIFDVLLLMMRVLLLIRCSLVNKLSFDNIKL